MDNCPFLNIDSLYQVYIPIVQNTKNDFEYCKAMQRFLSHCNNGHTRVQDIPLYLDPYIARFYLETSYKDGKIIVENIEKQHADAVQIGDEITHINGMKALDYFRQNIIPYISASNQTYKIHQAIFNKTGLPHVFEKNTKLTLTVKSQNETKKVVLFANHEIPSNDATRANWVIAKNKKTDEIQVIIDTVNSFMYIHFPFLMKMETR